MCGIVGYSGKENFDYNKIQTLLLSNMIRGLDATGIYTPKSGLIKSIDPATIFLDKNQNNIKLDNTFIGHVRAKTYGANLEKNAHPFEYNNVIGVHNGTLIDPWGLAKKYGFDAVDFDVDSQVLYAIINKELQEDSDLNVLSMFEGAAALLFYNKIDNALCVFKNKERPLNIGILNDSIYISSLAESLHLIGINNTLEFKDNVLYTIIDGLVVNQKQYLPYVKPIIVLPAKQITENNITCESYVGFWTKTLVANNNFKKGEELFICNTLEKEILATKVLDDTFVTVKNYNESSFIVNRHHLDAKYVINLRKSSTLAKVMFDLVSEKKVIAKRGDIVKILDAKKSTVDTGVDLFVYNYSNKIQYTINSRYLLSFLDTPQELTEQYDMAKSKNFYKNKSLKDRFLSFISKDKLPNKEKTLDMLLEETCNKDDYLTDSPFCSMEDIITVDPDPIVDIESYSKFIEFLDYGLNTVVDDICDQVLLFLKIYNPNDETVKGVIKIINTILTPLKDAVEEADVIETLNSTYKSEEYD